MPKYLTNTTFFNDGLGTYIANGVVQTNKVVSNGDVVLSGVIQNGSNYIRFNEQYQFIDIDHNMHIYGTGFIDYQGTTYNIGQILSAFVGTGQISPYPSITYNSTTNETTFTGLLVFPNSSIASSTIINNDFLTYSTNQNVSGQKSFSGTQIFSSIQLNGDLIVNTGGTSLSNSNLSKIQYISGLTSDLNTRLNTDETNITTLQTKTTGLSYSGTTTEISNSLSSSIFTFSTSINGVSNSVFDNIMLYCNSLTGNVQTAIDAANLNINGLKTKTTNITYSSPITTISNTLASTTFTSSTITFSTSINGATKSVFDNIMLNCNTLSGNVQTQINNAQSSADNAQSTANTAKDSASNAQSTANSALALAGTANGLAITANGLAGTALTSANTANSVNVTQQASIDQNITDITALQAKTFSISRTAITNVTSIGGTLTTPTLRITSLDSGLNQTTTDQITLAGLLRCNNRVEINNTLELVNGNNIILEGIINQDNANAGTNLFQAPVNMFGNVIMSGANVSINATTTQIGTSAVSTLNCNSTASFGGDITMLSSKNLRLKNIVPILLDSIYFGGEAGGYLNDDVVFNMKIVANRPVSVNNTFQVGTSINRNTMTAYNTTSLLDANTSITLNSPIINITAPYVAIGQTLGFNYLFGTTFVQNLYSSSGIVGMAGQVFQQF